MLLNITRIKISVSNLQFITGVSRNQLGDHSYHQQILVPIYMLILIINLIGNIPYSFTNTAQFITSFSLSFSIFFSLISIGLLYNQAYFFNLFLPSGVPIILAPLLIFIEVLSFCSRVVSLAVRLSANLISGHTLMHMISLGCSLLILTGKILFILYPIPFLILSSLSVIEIAISALQAYVFVLLSLSYIHDSIYLH